MKKIKKMNKKELRKEVKRLKFINSLQEMKIAEALYAIENLKNTNIEDDIDRSSIFPTMIKPMDISSNYGNLYIKNNSAKDSLNNFEIKYSIRDEIYMGQYNTGNEEAIDRIIDIIGDYELKIDYSKRYVKFEQNFDDLCSSSLFSNEIIERVLDLIDMIDVNSEDSKIKDMHHKYLGTIANVLNSVKSSPIVARKNEITPDNLYEIAILMGKEDEREPNRSRNEYNDVLDDICSSMRNIVKPFMILYPFEYIKLLGIFGITEDDVERLHFDATVNNNLYDINLFTQLPEDMKIYDKAIEKFITLFGKDDLYWISHIKDVQKYCEDNNINIQGTCPEFDKAIKEREDQYTHCIDITN